jgi:hypothetical protein
VLGAIQVDGVIEETTRFAASMSGNPVEVPSGAIATCQYSKFYVEGADLRTQRRRREPQLAARAEDRSILGHTPEVEEVAVVELRRHGTSKGKPNRDGA